MKKVLFAILLVFSFATGILNGVAYATPSPFGPDDKTPGCVTRAEFQAIKPVDRLHFAPFALTRVDMLKWFDAKPHRVFTYVYKTGEGGIFAGGTERIQYYHACFGIPRLGIRRAIVSVEFNKAPALRRSGFPRFRSTDAYAF